MLPITHPRPLPRAHHLYEFCVWLFYFTQMLISENNKNNKNNDIKNNNKQHMSAKYIFCKQKLKVKLQDIYFIP